MLKGGVIMDVVTPEQAKIAEDAGAAAVMALERVPADIRRDGGVARMSDPEMIQGIQEAVTIPVMAKARIGHFVEAQVLEALEVDYIDESEVLTPADEANHIDKWAFKVPFVCGATNLGEALRRIGEGAAMIRSKGEAGTGDIVEAVRHLRMIRGEIRRLTMLDDAELATAAKELGAPLHLVRQVAADGRLPVVLFCAGGIATPADAALVMQLGAEGVFVGSGIFKSEDPGAPRPRDRRGDHPLPGPGARRRRIDRPRPADGQPRDLEARGRAAARAARLVARDVGAARRSSSASSPSRATSRRTPRSLRALGAEPREVRVAGRPRGARRADHPRRRVDGDDARDRARGARRAAARARRAPARRCSARAPGMIMLDRDHLGVLDITRRAQRVRAPAALVRGRPRRRRARRRSGARRVHPRAVGRRARRRASRCSAAVDGHPVAVRQGNVIAVAFHPELAGETRLHELLLGMNGRALRTPAALALGVGAELALERGPVERRHAVGLGRRLLVDGLLARRADPRSRVPRESQAANAQTTIPAAYTRPASIGWCVSEASAADGVQAERREHQPPQLDARDRTARRARVQADEDRRPPSTIASTSFHAI